MNFIMSNSLLQNFSTKGPSGKCWRRLTRGGQSNADYCWRGGRGGQPKADHCWRNTWTAPNRFAHIFPLPWIQKLLPWSDGLLHVMRARSPVMIFLFLPLFSYSKCAWWNMVAKSLQHCMDCRSAPKVCFIPESSNAWKDEKGGWFSCCTTVCNAMSKTRFAKVRDF